jgi:hypothetical protein
VATGFFQKKLSQEGPPTLATALLKAFPDPQEALFQSPEGQALHRQGRTEELARASLIGVDPVVPRLARDPLLPQAGLWPHPGPLRPEVRAVERLEILGLPLDPVDMEEALKRIGGFLEEAWTHQVVTLNPEMVVRAQEDEALRRAVLEAELITPDGVGILWAAKRLKGVALKERVTGWTSPWPFSGAFPGSGSTSWEGSPG